MAEWSQALAELLEECSPSQEPRNIDGWASALEDICDDCDASADAQAGDEWERALAELMSGPSEPLEDAPQDPVSQEDPIEDAQEDPNVEDVLALPAAPAALDRPLEDALQEPQVFALARTSRADADLPTDALRVSQHFLAGKSGVASITNLAKELDCDRKVIREIRIASASAAVTFERRSWQELERRLCANNDLELLCYVEFASYDGVDMWLGSKSPKLALPSPRPSEEVRAEAVVAVPAPQAQPLAERYHQNTGLTRLLHTETAVLMLVKSADRYMIMQCQHLNWLQAVDRHTSENMCAAQKDLCIGTPDRDKFSRKLRITTTDGASNNAKTERHLIRSRDNWQSLRFLCNVHIVSGIHNKVFDHLKSTTTGLYAFARSLDGGGYMGTFRKALLQVLSRRLAIKKTYVLSRDA